MSKLEKALRRSVWFVAGLCLAAVVAIDLLVAAEMLQRFPAFLGQ